MSDITGKRQVHLQNNQTDLKSNHIIWLTSACGPPVGANSCSVNLNDVM